MRGSRHPRAGVGVGTAAAVATGREQPREASTCVGEGVAGPRCRCTAGSGLEPCLPRSHPVQLSGSRLRGLV